MRSPLSREYATSVAKNAGRVASGQARGNKVGTSVVSGVMWLGRAVVFAAGLAVILVLLFVAAKMVLGAGSPSRAVPTR